MSSGVLSTRWGRALYEWLYEQYKIFLEAGDIRLLASLVQPRQTIVDVGANIGFFTKRFARWVSEGGRVIAIEPEEVNFRSLQRMLARHHITHVVEPLQAVADHATGTVNLKLNPIHPADHRIADEGVPVQAFTLDELLAARGWPPIALIKIDVQGAEERVLRGATETLRRFLPALFIEIDESALKAMRSAPERVFEFLASYGYRIHRITHGKLSPPLSQQEATAYVRRSDYIDLLFLTDCSG